jgi:TPR repeat protein
MQDLLDSEEAEWWLKRGLKLSEEHKFDEAFACFEKGLTVVPQHPDLQFRIGLAHKWGHGVPEDQAQAASWFRRAAEQGLAHAQNRLALAYRLGDGVPEDHNQAAAWYRKAAEQGDADAQYMLAMLYQYGRGVPHDPEQVSFWLLKSADGDDIGAQIELGWLYETGEIVPQDYAQAAYWYLRVADLNGGFYDVQYRLGRMYENGLGVSKNREEAVRWYRKTAEIGYSAAITALSQLLNFDPKRGRPLDYETARAILHEAGEDPVKATELARERGYEVN